MDSRLECSICLNKINPEWEDVVDLDCGHSFHTKCIDMWLNVNNTCPNCRKIVITQFKCKYTPYPFLPFIGRKSCTLKIEENCINIKFDKEPHLRHHFNFYDIEKVLLLNESVVIRHKIGEDFMGRSKCKNYSYEFNDLRFAINIFNTLCNKLNQEYVTVRNLLVN